MRDHSRDFTQIGMLLSLILVATPAWSLPQQNPGASVSVNPTQPGPAGLPELHLGQPIERELKGGETHSYRVDLQAGQFMHAVVEQKGIDVVVALVGPDGKPIVEMDSPNGAWGPERVSLITETCGSYRVDVRSDDKKAPLGHYRVEIAELRPAGLQDRDRISAERLFIEAGNTMEQPKAIEKYERALALFRSGGDHSGEASTLHYIGRGYLIAGEYQKALQYFSQALPLEQAAGDRVSEANTLSDIGLAYTNLSLSPQKALDYHKQALQLERAEEDREGEAYTLQLMGMIHSSLGEFQKELDDYKQAWYLARAAGDRPQEASALGKIGYAHYLLGDKSKALDYLDKSLVMWRELGERAQEASQLFFIGQIWNDLGEQDKALRYYNLALPIVRALGNRTSEASTLLQVGSAYSQLGAKETALEYYNRALLLARATGNRGLEIVTLVIIGAVTSKEEKQKGLEYYKQALLLARSDGNEVEEAGVLRAVGSAYAGLGESQKALDYLNQALTFFRAWGDSPALAMTLSLKARVERDAGQLSAARGDSETALNLVETFRTRVAREDLRTSYFSTHQNHYELYIDILMRMQGQHPGSAENAIALEASERRRARTLLEALAEAHADVRQGVDASLLAREHNLQQVIDGKSQARLKLLSAAHPNEEAAAALKKEIDSLLDQYQDVEAQIRATSPRYAALTQPHPLNAKEIQQLLDPDTLLLEYSLGSDRSYLWAVAPDSLTAYTLPRRNEIENLASRVYRLLTGSYSEPVAHDLDAATKELSQMVLGPIASRLGNKRLVIVADGALQYVPFAALPAPVSAAGEGKSKASPGASTEPSRPLIVDHEIVNLPSASVLAELRRETLGRKLAPKLVAVLADPVFTANDDRVRRGTAAISANVVTTAAAGGESQRPLAEEAGSGYDGRQRSAVGEELMADTNINLTALAFNRSVMESGVATKAEAIPRLKGTRKEGEAILGILPTGQALAKFDFDASLAAATNPELSQYQIVHFATHGLVDSEHPELSGVLLSLVDQQGKPVNGFLQLHDVYNLNLPAELVVLSACQTALGKDVKGEGLVGLTRGFMYAGARRVVASLWSVYDPSTAELMTKFYEGMLKQGMRPAAALRAAQIAMWKEKKWQAPYYWAPFVLQGEWN